MHLSRQLLNKSEQVLSSILAEDVLSKNNIARCMKVLKAMGSYNVHQEKTKPKNAAVLVPLCLVNNTISLLFTVRAQNLKVNRGQVAFPGGMVDESDENLTQTALRETFEEIGVPQKKVQVYGTGPTIGRDDMDVTPVLGYLGEVDISQLKLNPEEVEKVFTLSLDHLSTAKNFQTTHFRKGNDLGYQLPVYLGGPERVWGLTAIFTHIMLKAIIPNHYHHKVKLQAKNRILA